LVTGILGISTGWCNQVRNGGIRKV